MDIIFLDFKKAFDKVPHKRLLLKLEALGIGGELLDWIECWLGNRQQRVIIGGESSAWQEVTSGVPQGSVLGPVLFIVYINDIDEGILNRILKFADDTKVVGRVTSEQEVKELHEDLGRIFEWSEKWLMPFNEGKCRVMHMGRNNREERMDLNGKVLQVVSEEKDLGVIISRDMKVALQCGSAAKRGIRCWG